MEVWKDVNFIDNNGRHHDYTGSYQVSSYGRVRSLDRNVLNPKTNVYQFYHGKILKGTESHGYKCVFLKTTKPSYRISFHRLVAFHFVENPNNNPCVEHMDTNKTNNRADNLKWSTYTENNNNPITKMKQCVANKLASTPEKRKKLRVASIRQFSNRQANCAIGIIDSETKEEFDSISKAAISINKDPEWLARKLRGDTKNDTKFEYKKKYVKIKSIKRKKYKGKVYDLEVANKRSYNIEGLVVHNSVSGSLLAYLMRITDVDPMEYGLFFERFIAEDRCLVGDTKIVTKDGLKEIRIIKSGDVTINRNGDFDTIEKVGKRHVKEKLLKIYFNDSHVVCTKDHKWIVLDKNNKEVEKRAKDIDILKDRLIRFKE